MPERERLNDLREYDILDTPREEEFDAITRLAAQICDTPIALINFIDENRYWNKSSVGMDVGEGPREDALCNETIRQETKLVVENLSESEKYGNHTFVKNNPDLEFYAGINIKSENDHNVGTLCVLDRQSRELTEKQTESLEYLAQEISTRLNLRRKRQELKRKNLKLHDKSWFLENTQDLMLQLDLDTNRIVSAHNIEKLDLGMSKKELEGAYLQDVFEEFEPERSFRRWVETADTRDQYSKEARLQTREKNELWSKLLATKNEQFVYLAIRDITDQHETRERLIAESEIKEKLIRNLPGIFCLLDEDGKLISWNKNFLEKTDFSEEKLRTHSSHQHYFGSEDGEKCIGDFFDQAIEDGQSRSECYLKTNSGDKIPILMSGFRVDYADESKSVAIAIDLSDRKEAEQQLQRQQKRFELATKASSDIIWDWDLEEDTIWRSEGIDKLFGYDSYDPANGREWWKEHIHPDDRENLVRSVNNFLESDDQLWSDTYRFLRADGSYAHIADSGFVVRDEQDNAVRMVGAIRDVTERKKTKKELMQTMEELNTAQRIAELGSFEWNPKKDRIHWSDEALRIYGLESSENPFSIEDFKQLIHPDDQEMVEQNIQKLLEGNDLEYDHRIVTQNGEIKHVQQRAKVDFDGASTWLIGGTIQDVTEQVRKREKLERFSKVVTETSNLVIIIDTEGNIEWVNEQFERTTGYTLREMRGKKPEKILKGPATDENTIQLVSEKISREEPVEVEMVNYTKQGEPYWVEISLDPVHNDEGELEEYFAIQRIITDQKRSEKKLQKSLQEKQVLLSEIHHRVKNNLAIISGLLKLEVMESDSPELEQKLQQSQMRIQSMALIHEKLYESHDLIHISFVDYLGDLIDSIQDAYGLADKGITLNSDIRNIKMNINQAISSGLLLHELLTNIIKHGFKQADNEDAAIHIKLSSKNGSAKLIVSDNGNGVPDDFEFQSSGSFGSTLIKTLIKQLDADMEIESDEVTKFIIRFELEDDKKGSSGNKKPVKETKGEQKAGSNIDLFPAE